MPKFTQRQLNFINEYVKDGNGTQSAIRAGYAESGAAVAATRLLIIDKIKNELARRMARRFERSELTADRVIRELSLIAFSNMEDYQSTNDNGESFVDLSKTDRDKWAAVQELTSEVYTEGRGDDAVPVKRTKIKLSDKRGALELLGKNLKIFTDKVEHTIGDPLDKLMESFNQQLEETKSEEPALLPETPAN